MAIIDAIINLSPTTTRRVRFVSETTYFLVSSYVVCNLVMDMPSGYSNPTAVYAYVGSLVLWCVLYACFQMNFDRVRYQNFRSFASIYSFVFTLAVLLAVLNFIIGLDNTAAASAVIFFVVSNGLIVARAGVRQLIRMSHNVSRKNVIVFGTSRASVDLLNAITFSNRYKAVCFVSGFATTSDTVLAGLPLIQVSDLQNFADKCGAEIVVIPEDDPTLFESNPIPLILKQTNLSVCYAPSMDQAFEYESRLTEIDAGEMLNRESGSGDLVNVSREIQGRVVLVTGGGGSIGSELCEQIIGCNPTKLIVAEMNEFALYSLEQRLAGAVDDQAVSGKVEYLLGSVADKQFLDRVFSSHRIDIVYHAAAYKHVPMVECNIKSALMNNVLGADMLAKAALDAGVGKFILVSSDKAVRPTNVMGASKRMAELICSNTFQGTETLFSTVRFGNVLGSSGSVIPKFKSQIMSGGPVTVTHPDVNRYFMSVPEAVSLVLNAGQLSAGHEVFLLDMGAPVKIIDLATRMIRRHGLQPSLVADLGDVEESNYTIPITFTGLRPGEKLFEELLISGEQVPTAHPKIFKSIEPEISRETIEAMIRNTLSLVENGTDEDIKHF